MDERMAPFVRGGRAAFGVVVEGLSSASPRGLRPSGRRDGRVQEIVVGRVTDLRRGLDYLETRTDIDKARIGVIAPSGDQART